jgi:FixJ family two-component response regulator
MAGLPKCTVAVVDDDSRIRESVESLLESVGHNAEVFSSAELFLKSPCFAETACLIADVRMPGIDGIELQRRTKLERPELPVIFISAHRDEATRRRAVEQGAVCFLYKPFDPADLLRAISTALCESPDDT